MRQKLPDKAQELRVRLAEAQNALRAVRAGEAIISNPLGGRRSACEDGQPYLTIVENMAEGAATLLRNGVVAYCHQRARQRDWD